MINEFGHPADASREDFAADLVGLSVRLAATPSPGPERAYGLLNIHAGGLMRRNAVRIGPLRV
jgi:hypothetical protein